MTRNMGARAATPELRQLRQEIAARDAERSMILAESDRRAQALSEAIAVGAEAQSRLQRIQEWVDANRQFLPRPMAWEIERLLQTAQAPQSGEHR
ncbi:hypothetical protein F8O06_05040 [Pseudoclavibacter sp. CFCC 14310]|uniref:hypothetical protein n=1 Tax=Pseudoclavibacter sp. CFCC 14310 TaxID=2615180 RepID=UPI0013010E58|nr:hypothetical protein [Pseudoclavibacter sp. CFCC 14310]KAB1645410.1 hypothetical protein F8O06_07405 [Pseudoclavibacter sp. CFCC 14310]KAB1646131.1 hypothetical protein F8O06_05040 [Pseudoclavibacter sp. CFCC 14310]